MRSAAVLLSVALLAAAPLAGAAPRSNAVYDANCGLCHQSGATGLPGQFPRLAGRIEPLAGRPEGRHYLLTVVLHGMSGKIVVDGAPILGVMPPFAQLSDADLANVLTFLTRPASGKAPSPFSAKEVAEVRKAAAPTLAQMQAMRAGLVESGLLVP